MGKDIESLVAVYYKTAFDTLIYAAGFSVELPFLESFVDRINQKGIHRKAVFSGKFDGIDEERDYHVLVPSSMILEIRYYKFDDDDIRFLRWHRTFKEVLALQNLPEPTAEKLDSVAYASCHFYDYKSHVKYSCKPKMRHKHLFTKKNGCLYSCAEWLEAIRLGQISLRGVNGIGVKTAKMIIDDLTVWHTTYRATT